MRVTIAIMAILVLSTQSIAGDYWPVGIDATYTYVNGDGELLEVTYSPYGEIISRYFLDGGTSVYQVTDIFEEDANGQAFWLSTSGYWEGAIDHDYWHSFETPIQFTQLPILPGASWSTFTYAPGYYSPCYVGYGFEVVGTAEVDVPFGVFSTYEIQSTVLMFCVPYPEAGSYFLDQNLGPMILPGGYELVSIDGVIGVENTSFGGLKALYR